MEIEVLRDCDSALAHNYGEMYIGDLYFGETLEDKDRFLETGGVKVHGSTAIPRGRYRISMYDSPKHGCRIPLIHDVPDFTAIEIHGGNTEIDTLGCILLGITRTSTGISGCGPINQKLRELLTAAEAKGEESYITVA